MGLTTEQLALRRTGIGASQVSALFGLNPWRTAYGLWEELTNEPKEFYHTESQEWGIALEPLVLTKVAQETREEVRACDTTYKHSKYPRVIATPDGFYVNRKGLIEIKTTDKDRRLDWGKPGTNEIPPYYALQAQQQMSVMRSHGHDVNFVDFGVLFGGNSFAMFIELYDPEWDQIICETIDKFYRNFVETKIPPPVDLYSKERGKFLQRLYSQPEKNVIIADDEMEKIVLGLKEAKTNASKAKSDLEYYQNRLKQAIGNATALQTSHGTFSWSYVSGRKGLSSSALLELAKAKGATPQEIEDCMIRSSDYRKFIQPRGFQDE